MTLNDLEPPKKGFIVIFRNFWMQRTFHHWIAMKWLEKDQDNLHMKFLALDPLGSRRPAQAGIKDGYLSKKWLFYRYWLM